MLYGCVKFRICCSFIFTLKCLYLHSLSINAITVCRFIKGICATYVFSLSFLYNIYKKSYLSGSVEITNKMQPSN